MKLEFKNTRSSALSLMRSAGYRFIRNNDRTGEEEYQRRITGGLYPRFHIFLKTEKDSIQINLHLDQKSASYEGFRAHSGEYEDSEVVKREAENISKIFRN